MALVTASVPFDNTAIDFVGEFYPGNTFTFQDNVNFTSEQGRVYEDVLRITYFGEPDFQGIWGGSGLAFDPNTYAFTAGTLTGFVGGSFVGSTFVQELAVEGISYSAAAFYNITISASIADDMEFIHTVFAGADTFNLSSQADVVDGFAGNDTLRGNGGDDTLLGNTGNDSLDGGSGNDSMDGGAGNDTYVVNASGDVTTESGTSLTEIDTVRSSVSRTLGANLEQLTLTGTAAINGTGNALANLINGNAAANLLAGGAGKDSLNGTAGNDTLNGGNDNDTLNGGNDNDTLNGGLGDDSMVGGAGNDSLAGGDGNDTYVVDALGDIVNELGTVASTIDLVKSSVNWTLGGNLERLTLTGAAAINGSGNTLANLITGNAAANRLAGGGGNDTLNAGAGNDTINGGAGNDSLTGGVGLDVFTFTTALGASNVDRITDFSIVDDRLQLENAVFTNLAVGATLNAANYRANLTGTAVDANDFVLYDTDSGQLFYDADGSGAGAKVLVAMLDGLPALTAADIWVV